MVAKSSSGCKNQRRSRQHKWLLFSLSGLNTEYNEISTRHSQIRLAREQNLAAENSISINRGRWLRASNHAQQINMNDSTDYEQSRTDDSLDELDAKYADHVQRHLAKRKSKGLYTQQSQEPRPTSSGFFSFLRWFKKSEKLNDSGSESCSVPGSPVLVRSQSSSCGSVDSIFSTATAASFAFVSPNAYKPFGGASAPEKCIAPGPDSDTYRRRLKQRDRLRELDKNVTLRKKYRLYSSDTLRNDFNKSPTDKNKKLKTKLMYEEHKDYSDLSLPTVKSVTLNDVALSEEAVRKHRRTVSDSSKDKKAGAYCHVKGKRKAPQPPSVSRCNYLSAGSLTGSDKTLTRSPTSSCGRKKRPAPPPPPPIGNGEDFRSISSQDIFKYSSEETNRYLSEGAISMDPSGLNNNNKERSKFFEECLSNDSLKLERGVLKSTKESTSYDSAQMSTKENKVKTPLSPVSPRPWYKRTLSGNKENSNTKKDSPKTLDKKKDKINDENLPEVGYSRNSTIFEGGRFSFFSKSQDTEKKKDVEKRKSGVSILANISELDREAAEIVNKEHAREQAMAAAHDDKFYEMPSFLRPRDLNQQVDQDETPKRQSAKELISRFNAITNVTKVTVNTAFFASKDNGNLFSKNGTKKTASYCSSKTIVETSKSREENDTEVKDNDTPPMKRSIFSTAGFKSNPSVTIEDTDKDLGSLAQQRFQANRARRPSSPTISTIVEQSESTTPVNNSTRSSLVFSTNEEVNKLRHVWVCKRCTLENPNWKVKCEVCDMWKPSAKDDNDKIKRPSSPVKHLNTDRKSVNDWEQELKKYFPNRNNKSGLMKSASETSVPKPKVVEVIPKITNANKPDYFIGSCDKKTDKVTVDFSEVEKDVKSLLEMEPNVEEVRKARLARFSANLEEVFNKDSSVACTDTINELDEQQKLFAMLKEMKNSLPKRPIPVKLDEKERKKIEDVKIALAETEKIEQEPKKFGAIKKLFKPKDIKIDKNNDKENKPQVAEAFVITTETIFEDIKVKKENSQNPKPIKVSSSCQTSAIVRKVEPQIQKENGTKEEVILPLSVEEMSTSRLKDGVILATLGNRTYELIKARDFADIKAIKTDKNNTKNMHIYANFPVYENTAQENTKQDGEDSSLKGNNKEVEQLSRELTLPKGIANFKEKLKKASVANTNTLAINRLLRSLETAISEGEHVQAARLAKDLAHLKVTCSVTRHRNSPPSDAVQGATIMVDLYVEDQISHQGPIPIQISFTMTVAKLKEKIAAEFEIPVGLQRWILGNQLASDDDKTLEEHHVTQSGSPVYLYLVAPDGDIEEIDVDASDNIKTNGIDSEELIPGWYYNEEEDTYSFCGSETSSSEEIHEQLLDEAAGGENNSDQEKCFSTLKIGWKCRQCTLINSPLKKNCLICNGDRPDDYKVPKEYLKKNDDAFYLQLINLDNADIVPNIDPFNCVVCFDNYEAGEGVVLRECLHTFCRGCLANIVQFNDEAEVKCPYRDETYACDSILQEREIKAIVTVEVYEHHLAKSIAQAENKIENAFHCKTPNCHGWCIFEDNVNAFKCPVCLHTNCLTCQAIHAGLDCKQYQERMQEDSETNAEARRTKEMLQEMVDRGEAMACPTCQVVLMKKWGCDWLRCSMCRTEICWVTRGPRWGPGGKGDTTGGCKCGVNGVKCHAKCNYCH